MFRVLGAGMRREKGGFAVEVDFALLLLLVMSQRTATKARRQRLQQAAECLRTRGHTAQRSFPPHSARMVGARTPHVPRMTRRLVVGHEVALGEDVIVLMHRCDTGKRSYFSDGLFMMAGRW